LVHTTIMLTIHALHGVISFTVIYVPAELSLHAWWRCCWTLAYVLGIVYLNCKRKIWCNTFTCTRNNYVAMC